MRLDAGKRYRVKQKWGTRKKNNQRSGVGELEIWGIGGIFCGGNENVGILFLIQRSAIHSRMSSRPVREKRQPKRDQDKVELNLELIEKLETSRRRGTQREEGLSAAKLLSNFINSANKNLHESRILLAEQRKISSRTAQQSQDQSHKMNQYSGDFTKKKTPTGSRPAEEARGQRTSNFYKHSDQIAQKGENKQRQEAPKKNTTQKSQQSGIVFNRAAYHVAIAYTIYLANLKNRSMQFSDHNCYDPTYPARKLKHEQMG